MPAAVPSLTQISEGCQVHNYTVVWFSGDAIVVTHTAIRVHVEKTKSQQL